MKTIMLLCGGKSGEHEVSLLSAKSIIEQLPKDKYKVILVGITKQGGRWITGKPFFENEDDTAKIKLARALDGAYLEAGHVNGEKIDVIFSVIHGSYGEDGCLQGLYELQNIPYVGSGVLASAVAMDKDVTKRLLQQENIHSVRSKTVYQWQEEYPNFDEISQEWEVKRLFVKPCNQGSSLGISFCENEIEYKKSLQQAFLYDTKILIEEAVIAKEIEVAVLGNEKPQASVPGEIEVKDAFYSYEKKYLEGEKNKIFIPARLSESLLREITEVAKRVFLILGLEGLGRIDFFVTDTGQYFVNEVNTLPGFTSNSMYPRLMQHMGLDASEWLTQLVDLALLRFEKRSNLKRSL